MNTNDFFMQDIKKRAKDIFDYYKTIKDIPLALECDILDNNSIGGKVRVSGEEILMEISSGTVSSLISDIRKSRQAYLSCALQKLTKAEVQNGEMAAEFVKPYGNDILVFSSEAITEAEANTEIVFAYRFLICHELAHCLNGHYLMLKDHFGEAFLNMDMMGDYYDTQKFYRENITDLDIKAIEMDADALAATNAFFNLMHLYMNFETQVQFHVMMNKDQLFDLWGSSMIFVFKWIEKNVKYDRIHPTPRYRAMDAYNIVQELIKKSILSHEEQQHAIDNVIRGMLSADKSYSEMMGTDRWFMENKLGVLYKNYLEEKETYDYIWENKIRSMLVPYAFLDLFRKA